MHPEQRSASAHDEPYAGPQQSERDRSAAPLPPAAAPRQLGAAPASARRARPGLLLLVAFLVELVVIAAVGNHWVTDRLQRHLGSNMFEQGSLSSLYSLSWRFSPRGGTDYDHIWLSQVTRVGVLLVLGPLLMLPLVRGPITFVRAFFGTWLAVIVAAMVAGFVHGLLIDPRVFGGRDDRLGFAMFGTAGPGTTAFWGGVGLGFLVALIVAIVAVASRRAPSAAVDPALVPGGPLPPSLGEHGAGRTGSADAPWQDRSFGPSQPGPGREFEPVGAPVPLSKSGDAQDAAQTTRIPAVREDAEAAQTTRLPAVEAPVAAQGEQTVATSSAAAPFGGDVTARQVPTAHDQPTTRFPRPPDDEDLDPEHDRA